ncbi:MAG: hypothetical protein GY749_37220 [Desulfobacteraceae bacterium]|nr:hypothetical protein [Desulfobacteraceae bacterium]
MFKKVVIATSIFLFSVSAVWAELYQFNEHQLTPRNTPYNIRHVSVVGYAVNLSGYSKYYYGAYGSWWAALEMVSTQRLYDFTGTLRYSNADYCNSICGDNWDSSNCYFIDHYNDGVRGKTDYNYTCTKIAHHSGRYGTTTRNTSDFWAPP